MIKAKIVIKIRKRLCNSDELEICKFLCFIFVLLFQIIFLSLLIFQIKINNVSTMAETNHRNRIIFSYLQKTYMYSIYQDEISNQNPYIFVVCTLYIY